MIRVYAFFLFFFNHKMRICAKGSLFWRAYFLTHESHKKNMDLNNDQRRPRRPPVPRFAAEIRTGTWLLAAVVARSVKHCMMPLSFRSRVHPFVRFRRPWPASEFERSSWSSNLLRYIYMNKITHEMLLGISHRASGFGKRLNFAFSRRLLTWSWQALRDINLCWVLPFYT